MAAEERFLGAFCQLKKINPKKLLLSNGRNQIMIGKKMIYLIIAAVVCGLAYTGWKLTSRNAYE